LDKARLLKVKRLLFVIVFLPVIAVAQTYSYSELASFSSEANGPMEVNGGLTMDSGGNLYAASAFGGLYNKGSVFKVTPTGVLTTLYSFTGGSDGNGSESTLVRDKAGNFYGITGPYPEYVVFKLTPNGTETVYYVFPSDVMPSAPDLTIDSAGNLYGYSQNPSSSGGSPVSVFKITPSGELSIVYNFCPASPCDGQGPSPYTSLIIDRAGNFYGVTDLLGAYNAGSVFKLTAEFAESVLFSFNPRNNQAFDPEAKLTQDSAGNLYGTTFGGGAAGVGTVFKIASNGVETTLYSFKGGKDGEWPLALTRDADGNLYGTTIYGGNGCCGKSERAPSNCCSGDGVVFKVSPEGKETVIYTVTEEGYIAGAGIGLVMDKRGNLYGVAPYGGPDGLGAIYKLTKK
jgi:uncharacterized repeat protein (TIGR03803 family)